MRRTKKCQISQKLITVDDKKVNFEGFKRADIIRLKDNIDLARSIVRIRIKFKLLVCD